MLGNSHGVDDRGLAACGIDACSLDQILGGDAGDLFDGLGIVLFDHFLQLIDVLAMLVNVGLILPSVFEDDIQHAVGPSHIGTAILAQPHLGVANDINLAGVNHQELCAIVLHGALDQGADHRMRLSGV